MALVKVEVIDGDSSRSWSVEMDAIMVADLMATLRDFAPVPVERVSLKEKFPLFPPNAKVEPIEPRVSRLVEENLELRRLLEELQRPRGDDDGLGGVRVPRRPNR